MEQPTISEQLVRRYLLGELPKRERERLEVGLLTDDHYYDTLSALEDEVEDQLIDQYLDGELTEPQRENFERVFLNTPERAHKLKLIKDLRDHAPVPKVAREYVPVNVETLPVVPLWQRSPVFAIFQNPVVGLSTAVALTLTLLFCAWLIIRSNRLETQLRQAQAQPPRDRALKEQVDELNRRNEELATKLQRSEEQRQGLEQELASIKIRESQDSNPRDKAAPSAPSYATVILSPTLRSISGDEPTLTVLPGNTEARLVVNIERVNPKDYKRFRAVVRKRVGQDEVWLAEDVKLTARGNNARAVLSVPVEKLTEGQYVVQLDGITSGDQSEQIVLYPFRVVYK